MFSRTNNVDGEMYNALDATRCGEISQTERKLNTASEIPTDINQNNRGVQQGEPIINLHHNICKWLT